MIQVQDLLGRSHEPLRCIGYVLLALRRKFPDFDSGEIPSTNEAAEAWLKAPGSSRRWREIGKSAFDARREGDVVYGESEKDGAYIAMLLDTNGGGFLTSSEGVGCRVLRRGDLENVRSVQRRT